MRPCRPIQVPVSSLIRGFISAHPSSKAAQTLLRTQETGGVADYQDTTTHLVLDCLFRLQCQAAASCQPGNTVPPPLLLLLDGFPRSASQAIAFERLLGPPGCLVADGRAALAGERAGPDVTVVLLRCGSRVSHQRMAARGREAAGGGQGAGVGADARLSSDESEAVLLYMAGRPERYRMVQVDAELPVGQVVAHVARHLHVGLW